MISIIEKRMAEAQRKAWECLARYNFYMFGYHAADWVSLRNLSPNAVQNPRNPFLELVLMAQRMFENAGIPVPHHFGVPDEIGEAYQADADQDLSALLAASLRTFQEKDGHTRDCPNYEGSDHVGSGLMCEINCESLRAALAAYDAN